MRKFPIKSILILLAGLTLSSCNGFNSNISSSNNNGSSISASSPNTNEKTIPDTPQNIPSEYFSQAEEKGTLEELWYDTYESFTYEQKTTKLRKRAMIYLPYNYSSDNEYNVMYLMHGGWSNEVGLLGTIDNPLTFKNVLDNAIINNIIEPMIIVCPTYNNTNQNGQDSDNYSLALQLTRNYHNELINDLIPSVESKYKTFASTTNKEDLIASRDHRAFMGFSMGSVTTWRTFEYCLDYFRYFFPSSGAITSDVNYMDQIVETSNYNDDDFFIWGMSGTNDFAYSAFSSQMNAMFNGKHFKKANNEKDGNIYFSVKEGYSHNGNAAMEYFYNALSWIWKRSNVSNYTINTKINDAINDPVLKDFSRYIFPINQSYYSGDTLGNLRLTWYNNINPNHTVEICNYFKNQTLNGEKVFYDIYSEEEKNIDPRKKDTGLFFFKGKQNAKFAITCAGGGWAYVGAMHDSFPHALELSKRGYNAFAIIYRPGAQTAYEDLARAISFIFKNAKELGVDTSDYSLWGGSAGGRMVATISSYGVEQFGGDKNIPKPSAAIIQYTVHSDYNPNGEPPTFVTVGENDGIANYQVMKTRINNLAKMGVPTEYHSYLGLGHGFGLGIGTIAEGWLDLAVSFWSNNI